MQQNMGGYQPGVQKEKFGAILVLMVIRVIVGAVIGTMTGLSMVVQPLSGGYGALTMIAGFLCVPAAILFFTRKPAFTWSFLIMAALNAVGGIIIASHPAMRLVSMFLPAQKIFLVLIIIMDVLFIIYLIRSKKVASIFGSNLFQVSGGGAPYKRQAPPYRPQPQTRQQRPAQVYEQPVEQADSQPYQPPQGQPEPQVYAQPQQQSYAQPQQGYTPPQPGYAQAQQQPYGQQSQAYGQPSPPPYQPQQQYAPAYQNPKQMKRGAFVGLCIGISAAAVIIMSLVLNNYYEKKYSSPSFGIDSLFGGDSLFGDDSGDDIWGGLFGSSDDSGESYEEDGDATDLQGYVDSEIGRDVKNSLNEMLQPSRSVSLSGLEIEATSYGLDILCFLPEDYYITNWDELNSAANEENRANVAEVLQQDIYEKTGMRDAEILFIYYDEDGYYMTEYAY